MNSICGLGQRIHWLKKKSDQNPLAYFRPTPPQERFINDPSNLKLFLGGNQTGKTAAASFLLASLCCNQHPTIQMPPPIEAWLITATHAQSRIIQEKLHSMIPKAELHPSTEFIRGRGYRGLEPLVRFSNGSIIRVKTSNQGLGLSGGSCALVVADEPIPEHTFNELLARTARGGKNGGRGIMAMTLTPVGEHDLTYLKDMVERNEISTTRASLTIRDTTPRGLRPLLTQEQIDGITSSYLPVDREQRITGELSVSPIGVVFDNFDSNMIISTPVPANGDYSFAIGIDHGSTPGSQCASLVCVDSRDLSEPRVYVLDEYVSGGKAPPEAHAHGILEMIQRQGLKGEMLKWVGDGAHHAKRTRDGYTMSNLLLVRSFEKILSYPHRGLPWKIGKVKKWRNSTYFTSSLIHSIMTRKHFFIHKGCKETIKAIQNWTLKNTQSARSTDINGHKIDAMRYAITSLLSTRTHTPSHIQMY